MWAGVRLVPWLRLLVRHRFRVSPSRIPRAAAITAASMANEILRAVQGAIWGRGLAAANLEADPILILGHWRSGTTLLHELLARDRQFRAPNTFQCAAPNHFVLSEEFAREWLGFLLPERRWMDAMPMGFDRPQEDELALCNLGLESPWWVIAFPNDPPPDPRWESLEELDERDRRRWVDLWTGFLRHVQFEHPGRLLLKNPLHTHRVPLIRGVFPMADFIHIVRDPHTLVPSCLHFWRRMFDRHGLQVPRGGDLESQVLQSILRMDRRLEAAWEEIPQRHRFRTRYEDLVADPLAVLRAIYAHFGWEGVADAEPAWRLHLAGQRDYRPNEHPSDPRLAARIAAELAETSRRYGYDAWPGGHRSPAAAACETTPGTSA